ncbi:MAG: hypothetical protein NTV34_13495 [Proteobacteria bacterium]|nr:hypothetical protein [Pseudomonadota bacterium]
MNFLSKLNTSILALALSNASFGTDRATAHQSADAFLQKAAAVSSELHQENPNENAIIESITAMLEDAIPVIHAFAAMNPQCAEQLNRVIQLYPEISGWTAREIRLNIEAAQALPAAEGCYPARDIVAHPAIVRAMSRAEITAAVAAKQSRELAEAIEHMTAIRDTLAITSQTTINN